MMGKDVDTTRNGLNSRQQQTLARAMGGMEGIMNTFEAAFTDLRQLITTKDEELVRLKDRMSNVATKLGFEDFGALEESLVSRSLRADVDDENTDRELQNHLDNGNVKDTANKDTIENLENLIINDTTMIVDRNDKSDENDYLSETESESSSAEICFSNREKVYPSVVNRDDKDVDERNTCKLKPDGMEEGRNETSRDMLQEALEVKDPPFNKRKEKLKEELCELDKTLVAEGNLTYPWSTPAAGPSKLTLSKDLAVPTTDLKPEEDNVFDFFGGASTSTPLPDKPPKKKNKLRKFLESLEVQQDNIECQGQKIVKTDSKSSSSMSDQPDFVQKYFEEVAARERLQEKYEGDREKWNMFKQWLYDKDREKNGYSDEKEKQEMGKVIEKVRSREKGKGRERNQAKEKEKREVEVKGSGEKENRDPLLRSNLLKDDPDEEPQSHEVQDMSILPRSRDPLLTWTDRPIIPLKTKGVVYEKSNQTKLLTKPAIEPATKLASAKQAQETPLPSPSKIRTFVVPSSSSPSPIRRKILKMVEKDIEGLSGNRDDNVKVSTKTTKDTKRNKKMKKKIDPIVIEISSSPDRPTSSAEAMPPPSLPLPRHPTSSNRTLPVSPLSRASQFKVVPTSFDTRPKLKKRKRTTIEEYFSGGPTTSQKAKAKSDHAIGVSTETSSEEVQSPTDDSDVTVVHKQASANATPNVSRGNDPSGSGNEIDKPVSRYRRNDGSGINSASKERSDKEGEQMYDEVVRGKDARRRLQHADDCECCADYYNSVLPHPPRLGPPVWRSPSPTKQHRTPTWTNRRLYTSTSDPTKSKSTYDWKEDQVAFDDESGSKDSFDEGEIESMAQIKQRKLAISRHRHLFQRALTPPDYWTIGFPTTQDAENINQRAKDMHEKKRKRDG